MTENGRPRTLFEKVWDSHIVRDQSHDTPAVLYIDLHLVHEVTSPQAFSMLRERGLVVRRPHQTIGTMDHSTPTTPRNELGIIPVADAMAARQLETFTKNCDDFGIPMYALGDEHQGIVHVIGPEKGLTQPGMTIVCGDSHTSTHGAFGALAFGIGTSEVGHVLATQTLLQNRPRTMAVNVEGRLGAGVTAKDIILAIIARIGIGGGTGHVFEYRGEAIRDLSMEGRMTVCNMSIEGGARAGMVEPDDTTFEYIRGRQHAPSGAEWDVAIANWRRLPTDDGAVFDKEITLNADQLIPMITYGTNPGMGMPIDSAVPTPEAESDYNKKIALDKALSYMDLQPGQKLLGKSIDVVFIGSCTNSRITDLRQAAEFIEGRKVANSVRMMVVPGSQQVKKQAESEGLDRIFREAGAEWREAGCSMCIAMNGDQLQPGQFAVSTSNRNFEGRQGKGGRTFLASPLTAAASAVAGAVTDPRTMLTWTELRRSAVEKLKQIHGSIVSIPVNDIDTDQIIPARFLKVTDKQGLGQAAFCDWRYLEDGETPDPDFVLNKPEYQGASVLVAGNNFGCGSSREHAPWALLGAGFKAVISTEFADIFRNNALKNGLLPILVDSETQQQLFSLADEDPRTSVSVDVEAQKLTLPDGRAVDFPLDGFSKYCLLNGVDQLGYLLALDDEVQAYEASNPQRVLTTA